MARTRLFGQLRRIAAQALAQRPPKHGHGRAPSPPLTRRQLLVGATATPLSALSSLPGCSSDDTKARPGSERIAVVGGGIAGLHCAYRLQQSGARVTLFEASTRVGGRMFTARDEAYDDQVFELGGELIDSNHATLLELADELDITLDDRFDEGIEPDVWFVNGAEVPEATIVEQFTAVAPALADAMSAADDEEDSTAFDELDATTLADFLEETVPVAEYAELNAILNVAYRGEFGLETSGQSALNLVYLIGSDEPDPFRIFGESDERYHAREGSDTFATRLADRLTEGTVSLSAKLTRVSGGDERGYSLELVNPKTGSKSEAHFDHVVLAIPYSVLRNVRVDAPLSELKRRIIDELGYGTNAKVMGQFDARVWREQHTKSGAVTADLPLQQTWDSSLGQPGKRGILTNFLGGQAGLDVGKGDPEAYYTGLLDDLERIFPGSKDAYRSGSARRMHWPSYEFTLGSYTCYQPGQWQFWTREGEREGNLHFCGEHTSADFQGWMEGGAETGARVAAEVLADLGLEPSPELARLLEPESAPGLPALRRAGLPRRVFRQRQRQLNQRRLERR
jgi:monoamine oxidase